MAIVLQPRGGYSSFEKTAMGGASRLQPCRAWSTPVSKALPSLFPGVLSKTAFWREMLENCFFLGGMEGGGIKFLGGNEA